MSGSSIPKLKAIWTPAIHTIFVDSCLDQTLNGNRPGTHFTKEGWTNIIESFNKASGLRYDKKQIKNHWDNTKEQWKIWCKLISTSSMKWDSKTGTFGASDEDWTNYMQANPEALHFRFKGLQHPDKLEIIFDFTLKTGDMKTPSLCKRKNDSLTTSLLHTKDLGPLKLDKRNDSVNEAVAGQSKYGKKFASEQGMCRSSFKKLKATWTPDYHKIFVDLCVEEVLKGNRPGNYLSKEGWMNIVHSFHEKAGVRYDRMQFRNHWDNMKEQWRVWCKLVGTSSMKWDPDTNTFGASEEDWVSYIKANPEAAQFRIKELQLADKLEIIFDGTINSGETQPLIRRRRLNDGSTTSLLGPKEPVTAKPVRITEGSFDAVESRTPETFQRSAISIHSTQGKLNYSIGECIECLDGMEEVEQGSDLYLFALDIFLKKEYREIFLQLKKPSIRIAWLQRLQSVGLLVR